LGGSVYHGLPFFKRGFALQAALFFGFSSLVLVQGEEVRFDGSEAEGGEDWRNGSVGVLQLVVQPHVNLLRSLLHFNVGFVGLLQLLL